MSKYTQGPCPCGISSDAFTTWEDGGYRCFSCNNDNIPKDYHRQNNNKEEPVEYTDYKTMWKDSKPEAIPSRNISETTARKYGVRSHYDGTGSVDKVLLPIHNHEGTYVGFKAKGMTPAVQKYQSFGINKKDGVLFGQHLFPAGGKFITITEGELDAMSAYEMLRTSKVPEPACVSLKDGASSLSVFKNPEVYKYINSFETIVVCFDADDPGQKAAETVLDYFDVKKVKQVKLDKKLKDSNAYLMHGLADEYRKAWWSAEDYRPRNILTFEDCWAQALERKKQPSYPYPWASLNALTYGIRMGELVTVTAQTGVGKTQILREMIKHFYETTDFSIGMLSLEETPASSAEGIVSTFVDAPIHLPDTVYDELRVADTVKKLSTDQRLYYYDDFGSNEINNILAKIQFFVKVLGVKIVCLDHISMIVSDQRHGDERKALDEIATKLKNSTVEWDYNLHMVAHLNREGEIRGTANIEKLSNIIINLDRDVKAADEKERNMTDLMVNKNRFSGKTGPGGVLGFDPQTYRMFETEREEKEE